MNETTKNDAAGAKPGPRRNPNRRLPDIDGALALIDKHFGIDRILKDEGKPILAKYYSQSRWGYEKIHSADAAMHMPLSEGDAYDPKGLEAQPREIIRVAREIGAKRIFELGCGQGYNARLIARECPEIEVVALDLMPAHVKKANERGADLPNFRAIQGSFEEIPKDIGSFDIVFAVETLCYASSAEDVSAQVFERLNPGGHFIMWDAFRRKGFEQMPENLQTAAKLYEYTLAVTHGFFAEGAWAEAMKKAGFGDVEVTDVTREARGGLIRLSRQSFSFLTKPKFRFYRWITPKYMKRNAVAGLIGSYMVAVDPFRRRFKQGSIVYEVVDAKKPV